MNISFSNQTTKIPSSNLPSLSGDEQLEEKLSINIFAGGLDATEKELFLGLVFGEEDGVELDLLPISELINPTLLWGGETVGIVSGWTSLSALNGSLGLLKVRTPSDRSLVPSFSLKGFWGRGGGEVVAGVLSCLGGNKGFSVMLFKLEAGAGRVVEDLGGFEMIE